MRPTTAFHCIHPNLPRQLETALDQSNDVDVHSLLAANFSHPSEVLANAFLSTSEKRCVLAAWASDAFAVESSPWLRQLPGAANPIPVAELLKSLRDLDDEDDPPPRHGGAVGLRAQCFEEPAMAVGF